MTEFIIFVLFLSTFVVSLIYNIVSTLKIQKLIQSLFQVNLDYFIVADQLSKSNIADNEGFIQFLVKSRDDAFSYIETAQNALSDFRDTVGPIISYHEKFGDVIFTPQTEQLNTIVKEYNKLITLLPKTQEGENK